MIFKTTPTFIITITEIAANSTSIEASVDENIEHYRRRVETNSAQPIIDALDTALKQLKPARKQRSDAGKKKGEAHE